MEPIVLRIESNVREKELERKASGACKRRVLAVNRRCGEVFVEGHQSFLVVLLKGSV